MPAEKTKTPALAVGAEIVEPCSEPRGFGMFDASVSGSASHCQTNSGPARTTSGRFAEHGEEAFVGRFWSRVSKSDGCWEWTGRKNRDGHGLAGRWPGRAGDQKAHVVAFYLGGSAWPPAGQVVRHACDNPGCVRPGHLELGSHADNVADRVARGRSAKGAANGRTRLSETQVREVAALADAGVLSLAEIGRRFGVDHGTVRAIATRRTWRHLWVA